VAQHFGLHEHFRLLVTQISLAPGRLRKRQFPAQPHLALLLLPWCGLRDLLAGDAEDPRTKPLDYRGQKANTIACLFSLRGHKRSSRARAVCDSNPQKVFLNELTVVRMVPNLPTFCPLDEPAGVWESFGNLYQWTFPQQLEAAADGRPVLRRLGDPTAFSGGLQRAVHSVKYPIRWRWCSSGGSAAKPLLEAMSRPG